MLNILTHFCPTRRSSDLAIGDQALRFRGERPHDRPFALLYQFKAPHGSWQPAPRFAKAFEDMEMPEPPTLYADLAGRPRAVRKADMQLPGMGDFREQVPASPPEHAHTRRHSHHLLKPNHSAHMDLTET